MKLSKTRQTKQLDLSAISCLVDSVLHSLDDDLTPAANWVLELLDSEDDIKQATGESISIEKIQAFHWHSIHSLFKRKHIKSLFF